MKEKFYFGYIYIKSSKALALLSLIAGLGFCFLLLIQWKTEKKELIYANNVELIVNLKELSDAYRLSKTKVVDLHSKLMTGEQESISLKPDPQIYKSYTTNDHFADLRIQLSNLKANSSIFKHLLIKDFTGSIDYLLNKMKKYAVQKSWLNEDTEAKKPKLENPKSQAETFRLLSIDKEAYESSLQSLQSSVDYLENLNKTVESDDSKQNIGILVKHLTKYKSLVRKVELDLAEDDDQSEAEKEGKRKIFVIMDKLETLKQDSVKLVANNWSLDGKYRDVNVLVEQQAKICKDSSIKSIQLNTQNIFWLTIIAGLTLLISMAILVIADLLKAIFAFTLK
ncbi:MAG: hypothetical protein NE330_19735 [Lentisphaeraceae bacterium]|nr:hypothetical protein [Lentisphaeraceae bacterium]